MRKFLLFLPTKLFPHASNKLLFVLTSLIGREYPPTQGRWILRPLVDPLSSVIADVDAAVVPNETPGTAGWDIPRVDPLH